MPIVYRTSPWMAERKRLEQQNKASADSGVRPISSVGGGRGGSLIAFTEATGSLR